MEVSEEYIDALNKFIDNNPPNDIHSILAQISSIEIFNGKQIYQQMKEGNANSKHIFFASNCWGISSYALYNSDINNKIYCVYTSLINKKMNFCRYVVIDDETIFDKYTDIK
jgi:hypothetical protein